MASKGQKFQNTEIELKEKIVAECLKGKSLRFVGKKYGISHNTIMTWIRKYRKNNTLESIVKRGRPKTSHLSELERLRLENEILKKFQAFLKKQQEKK